jgi:hypothetical protein
MVRPFTFRLPLIINDAFMLFDRIAVRFVTILRLRKLPFDIQSKQLEKQSDD